MTSAMSILGLFHDCPQAILCSIACSVFFLFFFFYVRNCRTAIVIPVRWPVIGMLPSIIINLNHLHNFMCNTLTATGLTFNFHGPWHSNMDFLVTCDPANILHIFTTNFPNYPKGDDFTEIFDLFGGGLFGADGDSWRLQRKLSHTILVDRTFRSFALAATREKAEFSLLPLLNRTADTGKTVDLDNLFSRVTFDVTCNMIFGVDPGSLSVNLPNIPFANAMDDFWEAVVFRHAVPKSWWKLAKLVGFGPERKMDHARKEIDKFIEQQIMRKRGNDSDCKQAGSDLLSYYMEQSFGEVKEYFQTEDEFLRDTVLFLMIAGRDAFSISLTWFFWLLSKNPSVEAKILEELSTRRHQMNLPAVFDAEELSNMVYLHGAVCETLRLYAPVPVEHKCAVRPDILPSGHHVKPGMKILVSIYAMGRMKEIWGEDWSEFKPERWVTETGKAKQVPAHKFMVFNSGPRSCLGKQIGLMQIKTVVAAVLWNFEVEVVKGQTGEPADSTMLRIQNGLNARIRKRGV